MPNFTQLDLSLVILFVLMGLGIFSSNNTLILSVAFLIIIKVSPFGSQIFPHLEKSGLSFGILCLTIGVLAPIASGKISTHDILKSFMSIKALMAVGVGVLVAYLGGRGVKLMSDEPQVITGLVIGTIAGVAGLRGVPVGPLVAAGILSVFYWHK